MDELLFLVFSFTSLFFFSKISTATNTLKPTQPLIDNQTLISSSQTFELGFFSPNNSNNWYLGIWYKNIPIQTIVWVANRENPITDSPRLLTIDGGGNLVLVNRNMSVVWTSSNHSSTAKNPIVQLLDSGNLVLKHEGKDIWQSFDYPTDTLLPGMKLGRNLKTDMNWQMRPWKNTNDPSPGDFTYGLDPRGFPQLVMRNGSLDKFRTGPWTGFAFNADPELRNNIVFRPIFVYNEEEQYYAFESNDKSIISRTMVTTSGFYQRLYWNHKKSTWIVIYTLQKDQCDAYNTCGAYGICNTYNTPLCECLKGFTPNSPKDWGQMDWSGGCRRRRPLDCKDGDRFLKFSSVKLPDASDFWLNRTMSLEECKDRCLNNCSCMAYANSDISGGGSGCFLWFGALFDIKQFSFVWQDSSLVWQDLYVRISSSENEAIVESKKKKRRVAVMISVTVVAGLVIICYFIWKSMTKQTVNEENNQNDGYTEENQREELELPQFDFYTIAEATNNFSISNKLGQGGFGPVYMGELPTGQEIAVKRLSKASGQGLNEFKNEVILIAKLQHRNLVRLLGCCIQREEKMLIYEYMPNKSLDYFIFDPERSTLLGWKRRFHIIMGIAQGLLYLHRDSRLRIIHRDLKASNVLLDNEMNPKISDFGMARTFRGNETEANTNTVVGTYGYMSPEYAIDGLFSMKSDVFSFGVLLLEIVSGSKNRGFDHPNHGLNLLGHAWRLWIEGKECELIDPLMGDPLPESEVLRCIHVGLLCVQLYPEDRPTMSSVILMLGSESAILPKPKQPGFYNERSLNEGSSESSKKRLSSSNEVTMTLIAGR